MSIVQEQAPPPSQEKKLFPIFRPKGERKTLYIIRHGESEFNAATNTGKGFSDPQIYDPKLTAKGQSQVCDFLPLVPRWLPCDITYLFCLLTAGCLLKTCKCQAL